MTMSPREAAWVVHHRTGADVTPCTLHERTGDVRAWAVRNPDVRNPQICTDGELVAWASRLEACGGHRGGMPLDRGAPQGAHHFGSGREPHEVGAGRDRELGCRVHKAVVTAPLRIPHAVGGEELGHLIGRHTRSVHPDPL